MTITQKLSLQDLKQAHCYWSLQVLEKSQKCLIIARFLQLQQEERKLAKLKKALKPEEFTAATLNITNRDQRLESLRSQYQELEDHYLHILERISSY